jgi:aminopeptidase N
MYEDGFESSVPIYQEIQNPADLNSLFTKIPIDKGAAILFMLEDTVGEDNFKQELKVTIHKVLFFSKISKKILYKYKELFNF